LGTHGELTPRIRKKGRKGDDKEQCKDLRRKERGKGREGRSPCTGAARKEVRKKI